jgi:hypothetical protein
MHHFKYMFRSHDQLQENEVIKSLILTLELQRDNKLQHRCFFCRHTPTGRGMLRNQGATACGPLRMYLCSLKTYYLLQVINQQGGSRLITRMFGDLRHIYGHLLSWKATVFCILSGLTICQRLHEEDTDSRLLLRRIYLIYYHSRCIIILY